MNLDDVGNVAEMLAAIGVMISLIYLAIQIRRSSESERMATYRSIVSDFAHLNESIASDPDLALLFARGLEEYDALTELERARLSQYFYGVFRHFENMFHQNERGFLDDEVWLGWSRMCLTYFHRPGFQSWWAVRRDVYSARFVDFLENNVSDVELVSYYKLANDKMKAQEAAS